MLIIPRNSHPPETTRAAASAAIILLNVPTAEEVCGRMESWAESKQSFEIPFAIEKC